MGLLNIFFVISGTVLISLGIIGIFVPGLPTTPFILLAAACYLRGSDKLYQALIKDKRIGKYIMIYREKGGMTIQTKFFSISIMWIMILVSVILCIPVVNVKYAIILLGIIGTIAMSVFVKTVD